MICAYLPGTDNINSYIASQQIATQFARHKIKIPHNLIHINDKRVKLADQIYIALQTLIYFPFQVILCAIKKQFLTTPPHQRERTVLSETSCIPEMQIISKDYKMPYS